MAATLAANFAAMCGGGKGQRAEGEQAAKGQSVIRQGVDLSLVEGVLPKSQPPRNKDNDPSLYK
jgi:hypothetical protein